MATASNSMTSSDMYLNIPTNLSVSVTATRSGSNPGIVHFDFTLSESQSAAGYYNYNVIKGRVEGYSDWYTIKQYGQIWEASTSFRLDIAVDESTTSKSFTINYAVFNDAQSGTVGAWAYLGVTVSFDAGSTPPSGLAWQLGNIFEDGAELSVSLQNWGTPNNAGGRYIEANATASRASYSNEPRRYIHGPNGTMSYKFTVRTSVTPSTAWGGTLEMKSNNRYYLGAYATNTSKSIQSSTTDMIGFYTNPTAPAAYFFENVNSTTSRFSLMDVSDGSSQAVTMQYRVYKSSAGGSSALTWNNAGSAGNHHTQQVTLSNLEPGTAYTVETRALAANGQVSDSIKTYPNAFTTLPPQVQILGVSFRYRNETSCYCDFRVLVSSTNLSGSVFVNYKAYVDGAITEQGTDATLKYNEEKRVTVYFPVNKVGCKVEMRVNPDGEITSYTFNTPDFSPSIAFLPNQFSKNETGTKVRIEYSITRGISAESATIRRYTDAYDSVTGSWVNNIDSWSGTWTYDTTLNFVMNRLTGEYAPKEYLPPRYTKLRFRAELVNSNGLSVSDSIIIKNPPIVWGRVVDGSGARFNIIGTRIKKKNGELTGLRSYNPVVFK